MKIGVHKVAMASPDDVGALEKLIDKGAVKPEEIVAVIGKTEGNSGANDFTRGYATLAFRLMLARKLGVAMADTVPRYRQLNEYGVGSGVTAEHVDFP